MSRTTTGSRRGRTTRRQPKRTGKRFDKIIQNAVLCAVVCLALLFSCWVIARASRPFRISYAESQEIAELRSETTRMEAENRRLRDQKGFLKTNRGQEVEARRIGFVKTGERAIIIGRPESIPDLDFAEPKTEKPKTEIQKLGIKLANFLVKDRGKDHAR